VYLQLAPLPGNSICLPACERKQLKTLNKFRL